MADTINELTSVLRTYIVSPLNAFGMGGYAFDVNSEEVATLSADITDHYTEDNKAIQDHIAIRPKKITLKGFVGEVNFSGSQNSEPGFLQTVPQKLTTLTAFLPRLASYATQAEEAISALGIAGPTSSALSSAIPPAANIYGLVKNSIGAFGNNERQQQAYQFFASCQSEGILMGIQTPWEFLTNMAIETIVAVQAEESIFVTDFSITFKQIRIAKTLTAVSPLGGTGGILSPGGIIQQGVASLMAQFTTNNGVCPGVGCPTSTLPGAQATISSGASLALQPVSNTFEYFQ